MNRNHVDQLLSLLAATYELLPIDSSLIAYEIILISMKYHSDGKELPLKVIFSNKNFTEMGARSHMSRLERGGWIRVIKSNYDLRVKVVQPTPRLIGVCEQFLKKIDG